MRRAKASRAIYAVVGLLGASAHAEAPLWRLVKLDFAEFRINADSRISQNPAFSRVLQDRLRNAEKTVRDEDRVAREEVEKSRAAGLTWNGRGDYGETLHLLALTGRHAAILTQEGMCAAGAFRCYSSEYVTLYRLGDVPTAYDGAQALTVEEQAGLLDRLARRDQSLAIGPLGQNCEQPSADRDKCADLGDLLGFVDGDPALFATAQDIQNFKTRVAGVGFTADPTGRVLTLDIYISYALLGSHSRAHRWPIPIEIAAPLLKPEIQDALLSANRPAGK